MRQLGLKESTTKWPFILASEPSPMSLFKEPRKHCDYCGTYFRPRVPDQRFCRAWCRRKFMALAGRAARRSWIAAGRPIPEELREAQPDA